MNPDGTVKVKEGETVTHGRCSKKKCIISSLIVFIIIVAVAFVLIITKTIDLAPTKKDNT